MEPGGGGCNEMMVPNATKVIPFFAISKNIQKGNGAGGCTEKSCPFLLSAKTYKKEMMVADATK